MCQSISRRYIAVTSFQQLKHVKSTNAAIKIQATWRGFTTLDQYMQTILDVVVVQSLIRRWMATECLQGLREEKRLAEDSAATIIASAWRGYICNSDYKRTVEGKPSCFSLGTTNIHFNLTCNIFWIVLHAADIILCQSIARRNNALSQAAVLRNDNRKRAAISIQSSWRSYSAETQYLQTVVDIIVIQSVVRKMIAARHFESLLVEKRLAEDAAATKIAARWRARVATDAFILTLVDIVIVQSLARRLAAQRLVGRRKELARFNAATLISSAWRRYRCTSEYECTVAGKRLSQRVSLLLTSFSSNTVEFLFIDIITCQSIHRRNVAMKEILWLLQTRHEEECACYIQEIWRAYVAKERFVRVVAGMERLKTVESKSATEIIKAWRAFAYQNKCESAIKGEVLSFNLVKMSCFSYWETHCIIE